MTRLLDVKDLRVTFSTYAGEVKAVRGLSLGLDEGETLSIVGESGCGKSVTAQAIMGLIEDPGRITGGSVRFQGKELTGLSRREMQRLRGTEMGMIFQDPMTSLNPTMNIGRQITEGMIKHRGIGKQKAWDRAIELLDVVGISNPKERVKQYPHQFSGGMRQRAMIAIALAADPKLLIADEPTTALDVTIQAQILELMERLKKEFGTAIILITHDLGVVAKMADRVLVMYAGMEAESGSVDDVFYRSRHPYTQGLLESIPNPRERKRQLLSIAGTPPDLFDPPKGCSFFDRCSHAMEVCRTFQPELLRVDEGHQAACWLMDERAKDVPAARKEVL